MDNIANVNEMDDANDKKPLENHSAVSNHDDNVDNVDQPANVAVVEELDENEGNSSSNEVDEQEEVELDQNDQVEDKSFHENITPAVDEVEQQQSDTNDNIDSNGSTAIENDQETKPAASNSNLESPQEPNPIDNIKSEEVANVDTLDVSNTEELVNDHPDQTRLDSTNVVQEDAAIDTPETSEFPKKNERELNPIIPQEESKLQSPPQDVEPSDNNVDSFLNSTANNEVIPQFSDDEIDEAAMSSSSESGPPTSPEIDSGSDSDYQISSQDEAEKDDDDLEEEEEGDAIVGPIVSKNEINEMAPVLPPGFAIPPNAPIELVGKITGLVDNSVIIEANVSGEFRTLKESSIFCFQDRSIVGPLFETFGRLQSPRYRVKFNTVEQFEKYVDSVGRDVYYVVPESEFLYTDSIKSMKGTDASNCHDEELPEDEQEYSDDENEAQAKNKRKKKNKRTNDNTDENRKRSRVEQTPAGNKFQPYGYAQPPSVSTYTPINKSGIPTNMQQVPQGQYAGTYSPNIPQSLPPQLLGGNFAPQGQNPNFQQSNYAQQPQLQNNFQLNDGYASPYGIPLHQAQQHGIYPPPQQGMYANMNRQQQFQQSYPQQSYQQQYQQPYQQGYPQQQLHQIPHGQYPPVQGQMHPNPPTQQMHQMGNQNQGQNQNQNYQPPYPQQPPK